MVAVQKNDSVISSLYDVSSEGKSDDDLAALDCIVYNTCCSPI